jgi:hypothetical protein
MPRSSCYSLHPPAYLRSKMVKLPPSSLPRAPACEVYALLPSRCSPFCLEFKNSGVQPLPACHFGQGR